jgi:hypothetical protein
MRMDTAKARPPLSAVEAILYFVIAALLVSTIGLRLFPGVLHGDLVNPDSYMRLDRLGDILTHHAPLDVVLRDASGDGAVMSWTHLLDSLLLLLALPLRPLLGQSAALHGAAVLLGPLGVGLLGVAAAWVMAPLADRGWRWTAPVLTALAPPIVSYGVPGVAHHHVLLALDAVLMAGSAGRAALGDRAAGWRLGVLAAAGIWLSPESMPFVLMAFGGAGLAWMLAPQDRARAISLEVESPGDKIARQNKDLEHVGASVSTEHALGATLAAAGSLFLLLVVCSFVVDPPFGGFGSVEIDRLSVVYVVLALVVFGVGWTLWGLDRAGLSPGRRAAGGAIVAVAGLALWFWLYPAVLRGPDGLMDSRSTKEFFGGIQEMRPVASVTQAVIFLLDGAVAALLLVWFALRDRSVLWAYAALCAGVMLVLGMLHVRFSTYAAVAGAAALPVALSECTRLLARRVPIVQAAARVGLVTVMMLANRADAIAGLFGGNAEAKAATLAAATCSLRGLGPMLAPYAGQVVLSDVNEVPELLYRTGVVAVGSLYTRNVVGFLRLRAAWRSGPSDTVPQAVRATRATLVLACMRPGRSALVDDLPPQTLLDRLNRNEAPPWLTLVAADPASGQRLYRIVEPARR